MGHPTVYDDIVDPADAGTLYQALKRLKNDIVGHVEQKEEYLNGDIVQYLLKVLKESDDEDCQLQVFQILCSFAHGPLEFVTKLIEFPVISTTIATVKTTNNPKLVTYCLRLLVAVYSAKYSSLEESDELIKILDEILTQNTSTADMVEQCCRLLPLLAKRPTKPPRLSHIASKLTPRVSTMLKLYQAGERQRSLEPGVSALASIMTDSYASTLLSEKNDMFLQGLVRLTRDESVPMQLAATALLTQLYRNASDEEQKALLVQPIIPTLVPIVCKGTEDVRASYTLASICQVDAKSSTMAMEVNVIDPIFALIKKLDFKDPSQSELLANNLRALSGIGMHKDEFRRAIIDHDGLNKALEAMSLKSDELPAVNLQKIKVAACHLLRSLTRSVSLLRTKLDQEEVAAGLMELLENIGEDQTEETLEVQSAAMAAVCNLILEFSPLHATLLNKGILEKIVPGTRSTHELLRVNSIWALKHAVYQEADSVKLEAIEKLTPKGMISLCDDQSLAVQEQAVDLLRNVVCGDENFLNQLMDMFDTDRFLEILESKIQTVNPEYPMICESSIYILAHMASGSELYRDVISDHQGLLAKMVELLKTESPGVRTAIVWLIINLTWIEQCNDRTRGDKCQRRARNLVSLGFKKQLEQASNDPVTDLRERVKTAMGQLDKLIGESYDADDEMSGWYCP